MTTFDLTEVSQFAADLAARSNGHAGGNGKSGAATDDELRRAAAACEEFREEVRRWGRAVFAGRVECDPEVERVFREGGRRLLDRTRGLLERENPGGGSAGEGRAALQAAVETLARFLDSWITPKLSVGPSPRLNHTFTEAEVTEAKRRIAAMRPPRPGWRWDAPAPGDLTGEAPDDRP